LIHFCDSPDRIPARIYVRVKEWSGGCPCCAFWRGAVLAAIAGAALGAILVRSLNG